MRMLSLITPSYFELPALARKPPSERANLAARRQAHAEAQSQDQANSTAPVPRPGKTTNYEIHGSNPTLKPHADDKANVPAL